MGHDGDELRLHGSALVRWVLIVAGFVCLALGTVGVFLPILPTVPFVLLAGACFLRGSERLHRWLLGTRLFGPIIREWRAQRTIPRRAKTVALVLIILSFGSSAVFFVPIPWVRILVGALGLLALVLVSRIPVRGEVRAGGGRRIALRMAAAGLGLLVALGASEVLCRIFWDDLRPRGEVVTRYPIVQPAPYTRATFGFRPDASFTGVYDGDPYGTLPPDATVHYRTNGLGFRDVEWAPRLEEDTSRVLVLGDSFAMGEGVEESRRFSSIVERSLAKGRERSVAVFNAAVSGYASVDEAVVARAVTPLVRPDVVLLAYVLNDPVAIVDSDYPPFDLIALRRGPVGEPGAPPDPPPIRLYGLLRERLESRALTKSTVEWYRGLFAGDDSAWVRSRRHLVSMRRAAAASGSKFAVAILPIFFRVGGEYPFARDHRMVRDFCNQEGIHVLDTQPAFAGLEDVSLVVHPKDHHPNTRAHAILAEAITELLRPLLR